MWARITNMYAFQARNIRRRKSGGREGGIWSGLHPGILFVKIGKIFLILAKGGKTIFVLLIIGMLLLFQGIPAAAKAEDQKGIRPQEQQVLKWRDERDVFFKTHARSPLLPHDKKEFKRLRYYPVDPGYVYDGQIERYVFNINNPRYYATFLTNKGTSKRYLRYGKFHFTLGGKEFGLEIYKSILSDTLFIPFKDKTNGKETYEGGRYIDAEILPDYKMIVDFNMAYNPSCAYNPSFACVLPPQENTLETVIRAGEKDFK